MNRPVRPVALVILTACMLYPGVTFLFQGLYVFFAGENFMLVGQTGPWLTLAQKLGLPAILPHLFKSALGLAWCAGVTGLWAGDPPVRLGKMALPGLAYPLTLLAAAGSLLAFGGPMVMAVIGLVCLLGFRENPDHVPA